MGPDLSYVSGDEAVSLYDPGRRRGPADAAEGSDCMRGSSLVPARGLDALRAAVVAALGPTGAPALAGPSGLLLAEAGASTAGRACARPGASAPPRHATASRPETGGATDHVVAAVERAREGDAEAFGELYDHYVDTVYRYVYYRVGAAPLAEDLTSETFLRALRRISSFTWQGRDFGAWLVTIARNLVTDHFKSGRFRLEVTTAEMVDEDRAEDGPEDAVLCSITNVTLLKAVTRLSPEQQECIVLRFLQGMSVAETARIMGKNDGAVKTLQYRAVRALARLVPQDIR